MNAPGLWVGVPLGVGGILWAWPRSSRWAAGIGAGVAAGLALLAGMAAIGEPLRITGSLAWRIEPSWSVLGRQFVLADADRGWLMLTYLAVALWMAGAYVVPQPAFAPGLVLVTAALGVSALAVRPPLYAVLLMEGAALASVPLLATPQRPAVRGVLRWLTFQFLALPVLLLAGWMFAPAARSTDPALALRLMWLLGLGLALLTSLFPFHSGLSLLSEEASPYALAWVVIVSLGLIGLWGLGLLVRSPWLTAAAPLGPWLRRVGVVMWLLGGLLAPFQRHAGRVMGYAALVEAGVLLTALSLGTQEGTQLFFYLWPVRALAWTVWGAALALLEAYGEGLAYRRLHGLGQRHPVLGLGAALGAMVLAGVPWFMGFPVRYALWSALAQAGPGYLAGALLGAVGLLGGGWRLVGVLFTAPASQTSWRWASRKGEALWVGMGLLALLLLGMFPRFWMPWLASAASRFLQIVPSSML